jgi:VWFA-related protein
VSRRCKRAPKNWASLVRTLSAGLALAATLAAQTTPTFRAAVALVHADAEVVEDGRILTGFTRDDFRILDEGKPQPIVQFSAGEQALDLILLFDISGSMRTAVSKVAAASHQALQELRQGDRVCVMVFNSRPREIAPFTDDLEAVRKTIEQDVMNLRFGGGTAILRATDAAALRFKPEPRNERRRAVLIITDNVPSRRGIERGVVRDYWEADALLSGLIISNPIFQTMNTVHLTINPLNRIAQGGMKGVAEKTGGDAISDKDAGTAFQESMRRIRSRYSLYYAQPDGQSGAMRTIRVSLTGDAAKQHPKARVRARTGYVVPKN